MGNSICQVPGCINPVHVVSRGLCRADYALWQRKGTVEIEVTRRYKQLDTETHKVCTSCAVLLPRGDFYKSSRAKDGLRGACKKCVNADNRARYYRDHEKNLARAREFESRPERREYVAKYRESYAKVNRDAFAERAARRRAMIREALVDDSITVEELRRRHGDDCYYCTKPLRFGSDCQGRLDPHMGSIEHVQPISRGGKQSWENVRLCCLDCNVRKNNKTESEWFTYLEAVAGGIESVQAFKGVAEAIAAGGGA